MSNRTRGRDGIGFSFEKMPAPDQPANQKTQLEAVEPQSKALQAVPVGSSLHRIRGFFKNDDTYFHRWRRW